MLNVNTNTKARVVLTDIGAQRLNEHNLQFHFSYGGWDADNEEKWFPTNYKCGDVYETELHQIMHIFGPTLIPGPPTPFKNNEITLLDF